MNDPRPTLLLFTRGPRSDARTRPLLPAGLSGEEIRLRERWIEAILEEGRRAGCEVLVSCDRRLSLPPGARSIPQIGRGFAGRLGEALRQALAAGGPVIAVGGDAPDLSAEHLRRTRKLLKQRPGAVVLGPARDGGIYLLATDRDLSGLLERVRWGGAHARSDLRRRLDAAGIPCLLLDPLSDLDRPADLERWLAGSERTPVDPRLLAALAVRRRPRCPSTLHRPSPGAIAGPTGRAPPAPLAA